MLNNYLYVFNTIWELNLTHWMDWGKLRHVVDDAVRSKLGEQLVETMQYSRAEQPVGYNVTQCYGLSLRGAARNSERARRGRASALAGSAASTSTRAMFRRIDGAPRALDPWRRRRAAQGIPYSILPGAPRHMRPSRLSVPPLKSVRSVNTR